MTDPTQLTDLDLAALLCSRVCHDVISPVGAIANGLEMLEEEGDEEMRKEAFDLVARSARQASAKLQFCRIAFGAAGATGASIDLGTAGDVTRLLIGDEKIELEWLAPRETRDKAEVKLLMNMVLIAVASIPFGGKITVSPHGQGFIVRASGKRAEVPDASQRILRGEYEPDELDARSIQAYYTRRLVAAAGFKLALGMDGEDAVLACAPAASAAA